MKNVLVLGAGMISRPLVRYLLEKTEHSVTMASRTVSKVERIIEAHPRSMAKAVDVTQSGALEPLISETDLVVSLLPYTYHVMVAELCIKYNKHLVTTSYISDAMRALDKKFKANGLISLNEIGLDPGIDHMSAMKIIDEVKKEGGKITSFCSYCGALPAPEANTNPFGYKFSWSPRGVLLASRNPARYLKDRREIDIPGKELFENYTIKNIAGVGSFEQYPNRNSLPYIDTYGISGTKTMYRATLRNIGWCETMRKFAELGLLDDTERNDLDGLNYIQLITKLIKGGKGKELKKELAKYLNIDVYSAIMKRIEWLGLLSNEKLPSGQKSVLDVITARMLEKLSYGENERDMIVLHHEFIAEYPAKKEKRLLTSTLVDFGIPGGDSAVARTVSLPAAIGIKLILNGKIKATGVHVPVIPEIYKPVLRELEALGIKFVETSEIIR
ncbi:saccharopine dehydrogenase NADP-binding domain-containing protein [Candidatus Woesearchaeota archaeon]|nr:saccharopine dehydrogenase NADP-binding domain-containing protein [Candidatus Woesearchaeota archaeon]